jgi:mannose-6-phosphate isomerase-like protein (cupin superfamily)
MTQSKPVLGPGEGDSVDLGGLGIRFMIDGERSGGGFSLVEHPLAPRALAAPLHRHANEDEYSYVLEGRMGADLGGEILTAEPGDLVFKPRNQWHSFWNPGDEPARILEIISPAGFERYFADLGDLAASGEPLGPDTVGPIAARYGLELDFASIPSLVERHGLKFPGA